jgi:hypothetical protein
MDPSMSGAPAKPSGDRRQAVCAWLEANGINPSDVPLDADMTISEGTAGRFLCCEVFELSPAGHRMVDERGKNAAVTTVAVPLQVEPPTWWKPHQKPTREDLLATLQRVQQLAERWKHTADRKIGPRQELVQALGDYTR